MSTSTGHLDGQVAGRPQKVAGRPEQVADRPELVLDRRTVRQRARASVATVAAWVIGLIFLLPVLAMLYVSFRSDTSGHASLNPPVLDGGFTTEGYSKFFGSQTGRSPWPYVINSLSASIVSTLLVLALAIPAAYALAVRRIKRWSDVLFFFLSTKFLPIAAGLVPLYVIALKIHALDHVWFLVILYMAMNLPIAVWMMRSFMADIPPALFEAAALDGAGLIKSLIRVAIPVVMPGIAATALISFIFSWNELLYATLLTSSSDAQTMPVLLIGLQGSTGGGTFLGAISAAATVISIPVLIAGFAAQDKLVQGLSMGAVK